MASHRVFISSLNIPGTVVVPASGLVFQYKREGVRYLVSLKGELILTGADAKKLYILQNAPCEVVTVSVQRYCEGSFIPFWQGFFTWSDVKVDFDKCRVDARTTENSALDCIENLWEVEQNFYAISTVEVYPFTGEYHVVCCQELSIDCELGDPLDCAGVDENDWTLLSNVAELDPESTGTCYQITCYHRIQAEGNCSGTTPSPPTYGTGWTLLSNSCPTSSIYWRDPGDFENVLLPMLQGRLFNEVLTAIFEEFSCGLIVRSCFFDINCDDSQPENQAYAFAAANLWALTIHQKSDVKRPLATDPALSEAYDVKPKDFLEDLLLMFNLDYRIEEDNAVFRLEHVSYFETQDIWDLSSVPKKRVYDHDQADNYNQEFYEYMDEFASEEFKGSPIRYNCGKGIVERRLRLISTDVATIQRLGSSEAIQDKGFVLIATEMQDGNRVMIDNNSPLSWTQLHENLFRHERLHPTGYINEQEMTFYSSRRRKQGEPFTTPYCCDDVATDNIETQLGIGRMESGDYDITKGTLKVQVNY